MPIPLHIYYVFNFTFLETLDILRGRLESHKGRLLIGMLSSQITRPTIMLWDEEKFNLYFDGLTLFMGNNKITFMDWPLHLSHYLFIFLSPCTCFLQLLLFCLHILFIFLSSLLMVIRSFPF